MSNKNRTDFDSKKDITIDSYVSNALWDLSSTSVTSISTQERYSFYNSDVAKYDNEKYENEDYSFTMILRRRPLYFMMNNIFPTLILNCITLLAFSLPFTSQIGLCKKLLNSFNFFR